MKSSAEPAAIILFSLAAMLPFVSKPLFVDDHAVFAQARDLADHHKVPYSTESDQSDSATRREVGEDNPPAFFYWLAALMKVFGPETWKARLATIPFQIAGLLAFYFIARRYVLHPLWATGLLGVMPHLWVTTNSLLVDSVLAPVMWIALFAWIRAWESPSLYWGLAAGFLLALAPMIKYTGLLIWPVAGLWVILESPKKGRFTWFWLTIPVAIFMSWQLYSHHFFGADHFTEVARSRMARPNWDRLLTLASFTAATSTCVWIPAMLGLAGPLHPGRRVMAWIILIGSMITVLSIRAPLSVGLSTGAWIALFFVWLWLIVPPGKPSRAWIFWVSWLGMGLAGLVIALGWTCARFLVLISAPLAILTVQSLEQSLPAWTNNRGFRRATLLGLTAIGVLFVQADFVQARVDWQAARWAEAWRIRSGHRGNCYFPSAALGGLSYYLSSTEWKGLAPGAQAPAGSVLLLPRRTLSRHFYPHMGAVQFLEETEYRTVNPIRVLNSWLWVGFYGSIWGPLPFAFSMEPIETYQLVACN